MRWGFGLGIGVGIGVGSELLMEWGGLGEYGLKARAPLDFGGRGTEGRWWLWLV